MALKYFGTDGIRGEYGGSTLNDEIAFRAGLAAVRLLKARYGTVAPKMVVGRDTRQSGRKLLAALGAGFRSEGGEIESIGVAPTPAIAKVVALGDAQVGCAITASHNPSGDNGLKFFERGGTKPSEEFERELDQGVGEARSNGSTLYPEIADDSSGKTENYVERVLGAFEPGFLAGKKIALDCANGALSAIAARVFESLGASVDVVGCTPDGLNINDGVGSECPQSMANMYSARGYDLGFAFDGDGDRMVAFDEKGSKLPGEAVLGLLALRFKETGELKNDTLVTTLQSNLGLDSALAENGISVKRVGIGDKFVSRLMIAEGYTLGGEESGHVVVGSFSMTGDGLFAALKVAQAVVETGASLAKLAAFYQSFPQETRAIRVAAKIPLEDCESLVSAEKEVLELLGDEGRLLVRYSGTEPKIRLLVEAKSVDLAQNAMEKLERAVGKDLG